MLLMSVYFMCLTKLNTIKNFIINIQQYRNPQIRVTLKVDMKKFVNLNTKINIESMVF